MDYRPIPQVFAAVGSNSGSFPKESQILHQRILNSQILPLRIPNSFPKNLKFFNSTPLQEEQQRTEHISSYVKTIFLDSYQKLCKGSKSKVDHSVFNAMVRDAIVAAQTKQAMMKKIEDEKQAAEQNRSMFNIFG